MMKMLVLVVISAIVIPSEADAFFSADEKCKAIGKFVDAICLSAYLKIKKSTEKVTTTTDATTTTEVDLCATNPCLNGGTCSVVNGEVVCDCVDGISGETCDACDENCITESLCISPDEVVGETSDCGNEICCRSG